MSESPDFVDLTPANLASEHVCCALSGKKHQEGVAEKKKFLARGFEAGLTFRKLDVRGKVFVEYAPAEAASRPVLAPGYLVIHCLRVSGRFQGQGLGAALLESCLDDIGQRDGVVAVTGRMIWLTHTEFFVRHGFEVAESTETGFDLVYYRRRQAASVPRFSERARRGVVDRADGVHFEYVHQCPMVQNSLREMSAAAEELGLSVSAEELETPERARDAASPFGTFGAFLHGKFLTHGQMSRDSFRKLLESALKADTVP